MISTIRKVLAAWFMLLAIKSDPDEAIKLCYSTVMIIESEKVAQAVERSMQAAKN